MMVLTANGFGGYTLTYEGCRVFIDGVRTSFGDLETAISYLNSNGFWVHKDLVVERVS